MKRELTAGQCNHVWLLCIWMAALAMGTSTALIAAEPLPVGLLKTEAFDRDPMWEALNNRLKPDEKDVHRVVQDFGYSQTNFVSGGAKGELGGQIQRSTKPAF